MGRLFFSIVVIFFVSSFGFAIDLLPVVDGAIRDGYPGIRDGIPNSIYANDLAFDVSNGLNFDSQGILEYDISLLPSTITEATLMFESRGWNGYTPNIYVYGFYGDGIITFDDYLKGNILDTYECVGGNNYIDVTSFLQGAISLEKHYVGFNLRTDYSPTPQSPYASYGTLEGESHNFSRAIRLNIVPEPASLVLMSLGGLVLRRRHRGRCKPQSLKMN